MKLIDITCPKCKATMEVDEKRKQVTCKYCDNKILIDDEVKKVKHIMVGQIDEEQEFINANTNLNKFKDYEEAYKGYLSLSKRYVDNPEVWLGLLRSLSMDFTNTNYNKLYLEYWGKFVSLSDEKTINKYKEKYEKFIDSFNEYDKRNANVVKTSNNDLIYATVIGGMFGVHKFMKGEVGKGILYLFTAGLFTIGWIIDILGEVNSHPDKKYKLYNSLAVLAIFLGIVYLEYGLIGPLLMIVSGILTFDSITKKVWKKPVVYSKFIKIALFIVGFVIAMESIPGYHGSWKSEDMKVTIDGTSIIVKVDNKSQTLTYKTQEKENEYIITSQDDKFIFKYDINKNELCLLENNECKTIFKLEE